MSFWPPIKTALESVFLRAAGVPFVWEEQARRMLRPPIGILELGQSMTVGRDAHAYTFIAAKSSDPASMWSLGSCLVIIMHGKRKVISTKFN